MTDEERIQPVTYTVDEMWAHDPCDDYQYDDLIRLWDGRERLSRLDLTYLTIPPEDIIWACTRDDDEVTRRFANMAADRAVRDHALHCGVAEVETWARKWLSGGDRSEEAANAAAWEAVWAAWAAWAAARAARAAARAADRADSAAASEVASTADRAAWAADSEAASAAERRHQVENMRACLFLCGEVE